MEKPPITLALVTFGITPAEVKPRVNIPHIQDLFDSEEYHHLHLGEDLRMQHFHTAAKLMWLHRSNPNTILLASGDHHCPNEHAEMFEMLRTRFIDSRVIDLAPGAEVPATL